MGVRTLVAWLVVWVAAATAWGRPEGIFLLRGKERPQRIIVTVGEKLEKQGAPASEMMGLLGGIVADISGAELGKFLATPMPRTKLVDARGNLERIGVAHVIGRSGVKRVELLAGNEGVFLAQEMEAETEGESPRVAKLDAKFMALLLSWPRYRGAIEEGTKGETEGERVAPGELVELSKPYSQAPIYLNQEMLGERFLRGHKSQYTVKRVLKDETMYVRVPKGYDPKRPAGLLVWISPQIEGKLPQVFTSALDELGIVGVGIRNVGNDRPPPDREQLALDALWTVSRRFHIDSRRVYVTGMSGGGRISSMMLMCFPDYFMGAVPIVGVEAYFNVPLGNGRYIPAKFQRPEQNVWALTKARRMGAITGEADFNYTEIKEEMRMMASDGMDVHMFEYKGLGHQMPSPAQFTEALKWVDEPYQKMREKETAAAKAGLEKYVEKFGRKPPAGDKQREELMKVTEAGAWTDAGWDAALLLRGVVPPERK